MSKQPTKSTQIHNGHNTTPKPIEEITAETNQEAEKNLKNSILVNASAAMKVSTAILPETCTGGASTPTREHKNH